MVSSRSLFFALRSIDRRELKMHPRMLRIHLRRNLQAPQGHFTIAFLDQRRTQKVVKIEVILTSRGRCSQTGKSLIPISKLKPGDSEE